MAKIKSYSIENDTANSRFNSEALDASMRADAVVGPIFDGINYQQGSDTFDCYLIVERTQAFDTAMDAIVASHTGVPLPEVPQQVQIMPHAGESSPLFAVQKPVGKLFKAITSHDFTDKTSWYSQSVRVTGESLTGSLLGPYSGTKPNWINLTSGLVPREDDFSSPYLPKIYVGGVEVTEGFTINHAAGTVLFDSIPGGAVTADYSYATGSSWCLVPESGKALRLEHAELDFTLDVQFAQVFFQIWAYNPNDLPNKMLVEQVIYKGFKDVLKIANEVQVTPQLYGFSSQVLRAVFDYSSIIELKDSFGMELRIATKDDAVMSGEFGSITLYTVSEDE